jgi:hypothetical protein
MKIEVTVKSTVEKRPSGHKPSTFFAGGIDYKETFSCRHWREHVKALMQLLDLSANQCGILKGEFPQDATFMMGMKKLLVDMDSLHKYVLAQLKKQEGK